MSLPKGLRTKQTMVCPHCGKSVETVITIVRCAVALSVKQYDRRGSPIFNKPIFSPRVVA